MLNALYQLIPSWNLAAQPYCYCLPSFIKTIFSTHNIKSISDKQLNSRANTALRQALNPDNIFKKDCLHDLVRLYSKNQSELTWEKSVPRLMLKLCQYANSTDHIDLPSDLLQPVLQFILLSENTKVLALRKELFGYLARLGYTKNQANLLPLFKAVFKANKPKALKQLLSHRKLIAPNKLLGYLKYFNDADRDNAFAFDLFPKLNPEIYRNKRWRALNTYERLYWLVNDEFQMTALSHRMGLKGVVTYNWQGQSRQNLGMEPPKPNLKELNIEANFNDVALIHFKSNILMYLAHAKHLDTKEHARASSVADKIINLFPLVEPAYRYKLKNQQGQIFYFGLEDDHATSGYRIGHTYYQINMGYGSGDKPGIQVFDIPVDKLELTHGFLCNTQYNHKTLHFHKIPQRCGLTLKYTLKLPYQLAGNCSYECLRGLLAAILFDEYLKDNEPEQAYIMAMNIYRSFCEFDIHDAIVDYREHALSINKALMTIAYDSKERCLHKLVFKDKSFQFLQEDKAPIVHHYTPMTKDNRVSVC